MLNTGTVAGGVDQTSLNFDALVQKNLGSNGPLNNFQNNIGLLKLQQSLMPTIVNQSRLTEIALLNSRLSPGIVPPTSNGLLNTSLQHKLLLDSVLQGQNISFLQNLSLQTQLLPRMNQVRPENIYNPGNIGLFNANDLVSGGAMLNNLNLGRGFASNPINLKDYQNLGSIPSKRICFGGLNNPAFC